MWLKSYGTSFRQGAKIRQLLRCATGAAVATYEPDASKIAS